MDEKRIAALPGKAPLWLSVWNFPLVALVVSLGLVVGAIFISGKLFSDLPSRLPRDAAIAGQGIAAVTLVWIAMKYGVARLGWRQHDDLPRVSALMDWARGLALGGGLMTAAVVIAAVLGIYRITGLGTGKDAVIALISAGLVAGFVEEVIFRGVLFRWIEEMLGSWVALAVTSTLFGFAHLANDNATIFSSVAIALEAGILLGAAYMFTRSLWLAIGLHMGWNITQGFIFAVPVSGHPVDGLLRAELSGHPLLSGGAFGLEASIIGLGVATAAGLLLLRRAIANGQIIRPMWGKPVQTKE